MAQAKIQRQPVRRGPAQRPEGRIDAEAGAVSVQIGRGLLALDPEGIDHRAGPAAVGLPAPQAVLALIGRGEGAVGGPRDVRSGRRDPVIEAEDVGERQSDETRTVRGVGRVQRIDGAEPVELGKTVGMTDAAVDPDAAAEGVAAVHAPGGGLEAISLGPARRGRDALAFMV